ncbi:hypothetical protein C6W19_25345 [Bacillus sp. RJGP41]|nr:hypothetical protein C6W19_25345 [Bacillus sp. RJGP41]
MEWIEEIDWNVFWKKLYDGLTPNYVFNFFSCNPNWIEEIYDTPAEKLASQDPAGACAEAA